MSYIKSSIEHNITGSVLLDLDYEALKAMDIKTVGERVRLTTAIKALRQDCYLAASLAARSTTRVKKNCKRKKRGESLYMCSQWYQRRLRMVNMKTCLQQQNHQSQLRQVVAQRVY